MQSIGGGGDNDDNNSQNDDLEFDLEGLETPSLDDNEPVVTESAPSEDISADSDDDLFDDLESSMEIVNEPAPEADPEPEPKLEAVDDAPLPETGGEEFNLDALEASLAAPMAELQEVKNDLESPADTSSGVNESSVSSILDQAKEDPSIVDEMIPDEPPAPETFEAPVAPKQQSPLSGDEALDNVREIGAKTTDSPPLKEPDTPFSLMITGNLDPQEREKLIDLVNELKLGIRASEISTQFDAGKVLIPRINEFAGVVIAQNMIGAQVEMKLAPADEIYSTDDTKESSSDLRAKSYGSEVSKLYVKESPVAAHQIPLLHTDHVPGHESCDIIDSVQASATLQTPAVEAKQTPEFRETVELLSKELRFKAYRKKASAVIEFKIDVRQLGTPTYYRVTAYGIAVSTSPAPPKNRARIELD